MSRSIQARLRQGRIGDLAWMVHRQAVVYAKEFRYSQVFETYLHEGAAVFLRRFDGRRDRIWMAVSSESKGRKSNSSESKGRKSSESVLGFIAIQHDPDRRGWAKLRWFLVEEEARGHGLGHRLLKAAIVFSRKAGYRGILLWTVDDLHAARTLYGSAGFRLAHQATEACPWAPWGHEQRWELRLAGPPGRIT